MPDRTLKKLRKLYPEITWTEFEPEDDIIENFGPGVILQGNLGMDYREYFILGEDKSKFKWGVIIANELHDTVDAPL